MNATQRRSHQQKRLRHRLKQLAKPKVKELCAEKGIDFARMELRRDDKLLVWDTSGKPHMIVIGL